MIISEQSPTVSIAASNVRHSSMELFGMDATETIATADSIRVLCRTLAPNEPREVVEAFVTELLPTSEVVEWQAGSSLFREGDAARALHVVLAGTVVLSKAFRDDGELYKLGRYHLNEQKGDLFVFEERTDIEIKTVQRGGLLGVTEFCATTSRSRRPCCVTTGLAGEHGARTLRLRFSALHSSMQEHPVLGFAFLQHISFLAGVSSLELLGSTRMLPFRSSFDATFLAQAAALEASPRAQL